ncbi:hypothetical protein R3W88_009673 [Solanum pinnatisectum]|uniref:NAC domain-containing protein n=1 Tax=Solanum pinnatisectum TaxID=50273 RepID=A0AAV9MBW0_9SOLN|nr:hypothetical protein R3W88_009673 [Solanum pinnatisectum]
MSKQMGIHFRPTDTKLINYLKRFFKGELSLNQQCAIQFADIYGDQPPWEIFGANFEEKFSRICAKGTWKGQTGEHLIRRNRTTPVIGFKRNLKFETSEKYHVANSFFKENNHILKEDFVKNVDHVMEAQDGDDVAGIIDLMLLEPNHNNDYSTREDQVRVCDEQDAAEATTIEFDVPNSTYEATTMEKRETTLEVEEGHGVNDIRSDEFQEEIYRAFEDIPVDIPDEWLQNSAVLQDI